MRKLSDYLFYEEPGIQLYCGDCREVLPLLEPIDVTLTDPPWKMRVGADEIVAGNARAVELWAEMVGKLQTRRLLIWLSIHSDPRDFLNPVAMPYLRAVYIRRAIPGYYGRVLMDGELIHVLGEWPPHRPGRMVIPGGMSITYQAADRVNDHPTPRSLIAARWLLSWWSDAADIVLDPFAGSSTTLEAAKHLGRHAIGIEIEPKYCEIAVKRLRQEVLPFPPAGRGAE